MALKNLLPFLAISSAFAGPIKLQESDGQLVFSHDGQEILTYHKAEYQPPKGVDPAFRRSGFIHPLKSPKGGTLTGIHPDDHWHHVGIWHAWVKTKHGADTPDFWNLGEKTGRARFTKVLEKTEDSFTVEQEQVAYKGKEKKETVVLREQLKVTVDIIDGKNVIDYQLTQTNVSGVKLELPAHRYGGAVAYRGPLTWNKDNSEYLSSEGKTRADSHLTRANWCAVYGAVETGEATLVFMCHPENHDAPQRLRTWPEGKMFLNWAATQEHDYAIGAGDSVTWNYRFITSDGKPDKAAIEKAWQDYVRKK